MPDRIIRDEILDSDRYWDLSSDSARLLFDHFMLVADDLGNAEATNSFIRRRLLQSTKPDDETIGALLADLSKVDIARTYLVNGKRYVHIPRFRQRLRSYKRVNPRPPSSIECSEISKLVSEMSDTCQTDDGQLHAHAAEGRKDKKEGKDKKEIKSTSGAKVNGNHAPSASGGRATRLSADWRLPPDWKQWAVDAHKIDPERVVRISLSFRDYWISVPGTKGVKLDWLATWRNWVRKECGDA